MDDQATKMSAIYNSKDFDITSFSIPSSWQVRQVGSMLAISPKNWEEMPCFWEKFYDFELDALKLYRRELIQMLKEESMLSNDYEDNEEEVFKDYTKPRIIELKVTKPR